MNDMIGQIVKPLFDAFDMYEVKSPALKSEVDSFRNRLTDFAEQYSDIMEYYNAFAASGLQEEYTDLISKVAVSSAGNGESDKSESKSSSQVTVKDFLAQYRSAYEGLCQRGSVRGRAAYEEVFRVADRTDDMLQAQIILEKERLLWRIVSEDALEIFEKKLEEMDPLFLSATAVLKGQIKCYESSASDEELVYRLALQEVENMQVITDFNCRMNLAAMLAVLIVEYLKARETLYEWQNDNAAKAALVGMMKKRSDIRRLVGFAGRYMDIPIEDVFRDPGIAIWMLNPRNIDQYGRQKRINNPDNLRLFRDVLEEEILADISIKDIVMK